MSSVLVSQVQSLSREPPTPVAWSAGPKWGSPGRVLLSVDT